MEDLTERSIAGCGLCKAEGKKSFDCRLSPGGQGRGPALQVAMESEQLLRALGLDGNGGIWIFLFKTHLPVF